MLRRIGLIVRRGALQRFASLKQQSADLPITVSWDRRQKDRRVSSAPSAEVAHDHRGPERRAQPAFTWELADFVVVEPTEPDNK
jgi:hypothetical protein